MGFFFLSFFFLSLAFKKLGRWFELKHRKRLICRSPRDDFSLNICMYYVKSRIITLQSCSSGMHFLLISQVSQRGGFWGSTQSVIAKFGWNGTIDLRLVALVASHRQKTAVITFHHTLNLCSTCFSSIMSNLFVFQLGLNCVRKLNF